MGSRHAYLQFADRLLPGTFANALHRPFYHEHFASIPIDPDRVDSNNIEEFPLLDRALVRVGGAAMAVASDGLCSTIFTGGTTGSAMVVPVSSAEREYVRAFHNELDPPCLAGALPRRGLHLVSPFNGTHIITPVAMRTHDIGIYDRGSFAFGRAILRNAQDDGEAQPHCTVLIGLERLLRAFTLDCAANLFQAHDSHVELVLTSGQQLTRKWRRYYCEAWGAQVIDRYGLAEVYGGATEDPETGWYLFDPPCFAEVIDVFDQRRIDRGVGELVLTSLFPFQQAFPLIRYRTGDLVEVSTALPGHEGCPAIKPLGRLDNACIVGRDVIPGAVFYEVFDDLAEVARTDILQDSIQLTDRRMLGHPRYSVLSSDTQFPARVTIAVEFATAWARDEMARRCTALAGQIRDEFERRMGATWPERIGIDIVAASIDDPDNPSYA